jgi:hypothetical protein
VTHRRGDAARNHRDRLPDPVDYFTALFGPVRFNSEGWGIAQCRFHHDRHPSLSIHTSGAYKCHACGQIGGSIIDFEMTLNGTDFRTAVRGLEAMR